MTQTENDTFIVAACRKLKRVCDAKATGEVIFTLRGGRPVRIQRRIDEEIKPETESEVK